MFTWVWEHQSLMGNTEMECFSPGNPRKIVILGFLENMPEQEYRLKNIHNFMIFANLQVPFPGTSNTLCANYSSRQKRNQLKHNITIFQHEFAYPPLQPIIRLLITITSNTFLAKHISILRNCLIHRCPLSYIMILA